MNYFSNYNKKKIIINHQFYRLGMYILVFMYLCIKGKIRKRGGKKEYLYVSRCFNKRFNSYDAHIIFLCAILKIFMS